MVANLLLLSSSSHCSEEDTVNSLDEIYDVGMFVHIFQMVMSQAGHVQLFVKGVRRHVVTVAADCSIFISILGSRLLKSFPLWALPTQKNKTRVILKLRNC